MAQIDDSRNITSPVKDLGYKSMAEPKQLNLGQSNANRAETFLDSHKAEDLPTPQKSQQFDIQLIEIINDEDRFYELEQFLSNKKNFDVDVLAFYVKVMEFQKEMNKQNATLAAGLIIDNYLTEDAEYYIGNAIGEEEAISKIISDFEFCITNQQSAKKQLFFAVTSQIKL